jgi:hypothetical protein
MEKKFLLLSELLGKVILAVHGLFPIYMPYTHIHMCLLCDDYDLYLLLGYS